ncbi:MAG: hypothetical protein JWL77_2990 [Chthonomonadaceae bacterium]|nr:hypothetical protein [Chthonomonadaceae bacterium]
MSKKLQPRWKSLVVLSTATISIVLYVLVGVRQERQEIVGRVQSGYRYRFTLSSAWQGDAGHLRMLDADTGAGNGLDDYVFKPRPSPLLLWSYRHLLHRPPPASPEIRLTTYAINDLPTFNFLHRFQGAYPEPILGDQERMVTHRHLTVGGCPTTVVRLEKTEFGRSCPGTQVLIDVASHTIVYDLHGYSLSPADDVNHEIETILSSFHVEKVAVPQATGARS